MSRLDEIKAHHLEYQRHGVYWGNLLPDLAFLIAELEKSAQEIERLKTIAGVRITPPSHMEMVFCETRERAETAERALAALKLGDEQRVRDISRLTIERDEAREALATQREALAKLADIERDCAATDLHDARQDEIYGRCEGSGGNFDAGRKAAAETIAASIRSGGGTHG